MTILDEILEELGNVDTIEEQRLVIIDYIERASEDSSYIPALESLADILFKTGSVDQGLTVLIELFELKKYKKYAKQIVSKLYQYEAYDKAYFYWLDLAKSDKEDPELKLLEARLLKKLNRHTEAIDMYRQIIKSYPTLGEAYEDLGDIYLEQQNISQAENYYRAVYEYLDDYENIRDVRLKLVEVESLKEIIDLAAVEKLEKDERIPLETEDEFFVFANVFKTLFQFDRAIDYAKKALQKNPDNINYSILLIELYKTTGQKSNLYKELTWSAKTLPPLDPMILNIAKVADDVDHLNDDIIEKLVDYTNLIDNSEDFYLAINIIVNYYLCKSDAAQALHFLRVFEGEQIDHEYMSYHFALVYEALGLNDKAEEDYLIALDYLLPHEELAYRLANFYFTNKEVEKALEVVNQYNNTFYDIPKLKALSKEIQSKNDLSDLDEYKEWE